ncbi:MAG TPA: hypothetical protein VIX17_26365, partial [Pyrinomonadaceae bacterium]
KPFVRLSCSLKKQGITTNDRLDDWSNARLCKVAYGKKWARGAKPPQLRVGCLLNSLCECELCGRRRKDIEGTRRRRWQRSSARWRALVAATSGYPMAGFCGFGG